MEADSAYFQSDETATGQPDKHSPSGKDARRQDTLPEEIVLKPDYSCYCTVCECSLSRIKDAIQHASGKRHQKAFKAKSETENSGTKRKASEEVFDDAKKNKTEETKDEEAQKMLSKVFDETFHGGVVALRDNYYCKVCRCMIGNNRKNVNQHKEGKSHKMALEKFKQSLLSGTIGDDIPVEDPNLPFEGDGYIEKGKNAKKKTTYYCRLCAFRTKDREAITEHMNGEKHQENIRIDKEREMFAQQGGYQRFQSDYYGKGAEGETYPEGSYRETGMEGFGPRGQFDGEPPFNNRWQQPFPNRHQPPFHNRQGLPFHGGYQDDINRNMWNPHSENFMPNPGNLHQSALVNEPMNHGHLMMPQVGGNPVNSLIPEPQPAQVPLAPNIQKDPISYMPQSQQTPVPFVPQSQQTPVPFVPQSHPAAFPFVPQSRPAAPPQSSEQVQVTNTASGGLLGFITNESDAEVVIDVISSLLQTYLKYRLQALPGSFMKLLRKSAKNEENVTRINKLSTGQTTKQIFISVQNHKSKAQSVSTPDNESLSQSVLYERRFTNANRSLKTATNEPMQYHENRDSYDKRSYIEDQLKKAAAARMLTGKQSEDNYSRKANDNRPINDLFDRRSGFQEKALENAMQTKSSVTDFSRRYTSSNNEDNFPRNESTTNDLFYRYRRATKEDTSSQSIRRNEPPSADFSHRYRSSELSNRYR